MVEIEVIDAEAPSRIVERNVATKAGRIGEGTYRLHALPSGGTHIEFEYRWIVAPIADRVASPLVRGFIRRANETAMRRLAERLANTEPRSGEFHITGDERSLKCSRSSSRQ